jgi:hypothetical protein
MHEVFAILAAVAAERSNAPKKTKSWILSSRYGKPDQAVSARKDNADEMGNAETQYNAAVL